MASPRANTEQYAINAACTLTYQLFLIFTSTTQRYDISDVTVMPHITKTYRFMLELRNDPQDDGTTYPLPDEHQIIKRAIIMHSRCNISWLMMKSLLVRLLQVVNANNRVDVIEVKPNMILELHAGQEQSYNHTVMRIRTAHGNFIIDLTSEQFGFDKIIILPEDQYLEFCTADKKVLHEAHNYPLELNQNTFNFSESTKWWRQARDKLERLEREWIDRLPAGRIQLEDVVSEPEREFLRGRLREMVYGRV